MKHVLVIDNYDSFVFNLVQYIGEAGAKVSVFRNDKIKLTDIDAIKPTHILISPGPGHPADPDYFGISAEIIKTYGKKIPLLGVCLGHQGIGQVFGAKVDKAPSIMHGKTSLITHDGKGVFANIKNPLQGMRYHSLCIIPESIPQELEVSAKSNDGVIMGIRHKEFPIEGIQFHPESIGTEHGKQMIHNFLAMQAHGK